MENTKEKFAPVEKDDFIMLPRVDYCFKRLMENEKVRKAFVAALMDVNKEEIEDTELMPTILLQDYPEEKFGVLDVRVRMHDGTQIEFEMQLLKFEYWSNRILFYVSKMYFEQLKSGMQYKDLKKCRQVSILNFEHFPEDNRYYHKIVLCDQETGEKYSDLIELHFLELTKVPKEMMEESEIIQWIRFFGAEDRKGLKAMADRNEDIAMAYHDLVRLSADEHERLLYEACEKARLDYESQMTSAREAGREEGEEKLNAMYERLLKENREEDMRRAIIDPGYRNELLRRYAVM